MAQPERGFRYGAEAFWLAGFALEGASPTSAIDLGTGSGIVALLLGGRGVQTRGYDVRPEWGPLWRRSLSHSRLDGRVQLLLGDVAAGMEGPVDVCVSNPPFYRRGDGPDIADPWRGAARTEGDAQLRDFVRVALHVIRPGGSACFVVPRQREAELLHATGAEGGRVEERVHVGRKRVVTRLRMGGGPLPAATTIPERGGRVQRWYRLARGEPSARKPTTGAP